MRKQTLKIDTGLRQQQRLTPLQVQFVRLLEMSAPEMEDEVARALSEMPALETADPMEAESRSPMATEDGEVFTETADDVQRADFANPDDVPDYLERVGETAADILPKPAIDHYDSAYTPAAYAPSSYVEPVVANTDETLFESLENQLTELKLSDTDRTAARYIIGSVDDNGYLTRSLSAMTDDLAVKEGMDISTEHLRSLLDIVRSLDPPGICATDLRDCLILQLQRRPRTTESVTALEVVKHYFDLLSKRHFDRIASALDISRSQLDGALTLISRLNPKPGSAFPSSSVPDSSRHISPDFLVEVDADGRVSLTSLSRLPQLCVDATFDVDLPEAPAADSRQEEARRFLRAKRDDARNFIRVVSQRQETLANVVAAIVSMQYRFFVTEADEDIRPMVLRDIAERTGYNLSVVSRATQGKYIATIRGVYPLKKFFNEKVRADNDDITANRIIAEIKRVIENESPARPLSDREITAQLAQAGYDIARRTVAKYRENLGFPVARLRRR